MNRADKVLLWIKLVLSLVQLVAALALIGPLLEPQLTDGIDRLETAIHGRQITLESTLTDRQGNPIPGATITVIRDNGTPYRDDNGNPARDVTDRNGGFKIKTTVKGSYRVEIVPPRQNQGSVRPRLT